MAAGFLPEPMTEYGPCSKPCKHIDCQETRDMAATTCAFCPKPIGYATAFVRSSRSFSLAHESCLILAVERGDDRAETF